MIEKEVKKEVCEMLVFEEEPGGRCVYIPRFICRDLNLNMEERGYLSILYALPEDTQFSFEMMTGFVSDGISDIRRVFRNLVAKGYVVPVLNRDENGRLVSKDLVLTIPDDAEILYLEGENDEQEQET